MTTDLHHYAAEKVRQTTREGSLQRIEIARNHYGLMTQPVVDWLISLLDSADGSIGPFGQNVRLGFTFDSLEGLIGHPNSDIKIGFVDVQRTINLVPAGVARISGDMVTFADDLPFMTVEIRRRHPWIRDVAGVTPFFQWVLDFADHHLDKIKAEGHTQFADFLPLTTVAMGRIYDIFPGMTVTSSDYMSKDNGLVSTFKFQASEREVTVKIDYQVMLKEYRDLKTRVIDPADAAKKAKEEKEGGA